MSYEVRFFWLLAILAQLGALGLTVMWLRGGPPQMLVFIIIACGAALGFAYRAGMGDK